MSVARWLYLACACLSACGFESAEEPQLIEMNMCSADRDCGANAVCSGGMCVARSADDAFTVKLEVIPLRMPDGSEALPFIKGGFRVDGPRSVQIELPMPVEVSGRVVSDGMPVPADVSFTPTHKIPNVPAKVVAAAIGEEPQDDDAAFRVRLQNGEEYRMSVRPRGGALPPLVQTIVAEQDASYDIDYDAIELEERSFAIAGAQGRALTVKAVNQRGETVSSTATLQDDAATLLFPRNLEGSVRLVISAEQVYEDAVVGGDASARDTCDRATPNYPVFSIEAEALADLEEAGESIVLPEPPDRIRFQGSIALCDDPGVSGNVFDSVPVSLRSQALSFVESAPIALSASSSTTTDAHYDRQSGEFRFCVDLMPGQYEVVVTPPASMRCAVFAEQRLIRSPDGVAATGALFQLPATFSLSGSLRTNTLMPLRGATVAAVALGRSAAFMLDEADQSLTQFNRSRETTSDEEGAFALSLDLGSYDILVKPPAGSGFPWQVHHDVNLNRGMLNTRFDMRPPVSLDGSLSYAGASAGDAAHASLEGAEVRAFVVIDDPFDTDRSIAVGKAIADADGRFTLLLPPALHEGL